MELFYIAKYALTKGIYKAYGRYFDNSQTIVIRNELGKTLDIIPQGIGAFKSKSEAIVYAEELRKQKITQLLSQIENLKKIDFVN